MKELHMTRERAHSEYIKEKKEAGHLREDVVFSNSYSAAE